MTPARAEQRHLAERLFGILDVFTPERPRLSLSDISRRAGLPVATAHRLVGQLTRCGALDRGDDGHYGIGIRLWQVASLEHRTLCLREVARPFMSELNDRTGCAVQLSVLDGRDIVIVDQVCGRGRPAHQDRIGDRVRAHTTVSGRVLLAHLPTAADLSTPQHRVLEGIRRSGIAVSEGKGAWESFAAAVPVRAADGTTIAALSVTGQPSKQAPGAVVQAIRTTAHELTGALRAASFDVTLAS
jgi:DNA-binding IclR family transcriptional regulator